MAEHNFEEDLLLFQRYLTRFSIEILNGDTHSFMHFIHFVEAL